MSIVHKVLQGESLSAIASKYGYKDGNIIYQHPGNLELRSMRPDPNTLLPGDRVTIPAIRKSEIKAASGQKHKFLRFRPTTKILRLKLDETHTNKFSEKEYELKIQKHDCCKGDYLILTGSLDENGCLEEEIPVSALKAILIVKTGEPPYKLNILIDHLDPADEISGIQGRLKNLGFDPGPIDGIAGPRTNEAINTYQRLNDCKVGEADKQTISHLQKKHKS
jgi:hypothetical protein